MHDFPKIIRLVRGGKARTAVLTQPYLHEGRCYDILRLAFITI